jgi:group I intron endonuclease
MSIGIYKITSPSGKIYVGQSINIEKRWKNYNKYVCINQNKLNNSFLKHGSENHQFDIIEKCLYEYLNIKERYWQDYYNVLGLNGLNCILTNTDELPRLISQDIKDKIGKANKGKQSCNKGKQLTQIHRENIGNSNRGQTRTQNTKNKMSVSHLKPVLQFNKDGILINEFISREDAKNQTGIDCQFVLVNKAKTAGGYIFIYKNTWDGNPPKITKNKNLGQSKPWLKGRVSPNKKLKENEETEDMAH